MGQDNRTPQEKSRRLSLRSSVGRDDVPRVMGPHTANDPQILTITAQPQGLYGNPHPDPGNVAHPMFHFRARDRGPNAPPGLFLSRLCRPNGMSQPRVHGV